MTANQNYANIIERIFGAGTATVDVLSEKRNDVTGALNHEQYEDFTSNFIARLERLQTIYAEHVEFLKEILVQVNLIADLKNWEGAFAELAAFDYLNQGFTSKRGIIHTPISPNTTFSKDISLAGKMGKSETNLDCHVPDVNLHLDVKVFKDNVTEILNGIFTAFQSRLGITGLNYISEHELDISYDEFKSKRRQLLDELSANVDARNRQTFLQSKIIPGLSYRMKWEAGVNSGIRSYEPFRHAENYHQTIFNYANKFMLGEPTVIILVTFPWYNNVISNFSNSNVEFYRAYARRVFCQYIHDPRRFDEHDKNFKGDETIYEVSTYLSGIIFLEDDTILSKNPDSVNVKSYVYLNPNAKNPIQGTMADEFLKIMHNAKFDHFEHDNY